MIDCTRLPKDQSKLQTIKSFEHPGEVNKARAMKQDWRVIASLSNAGEVLIYNYEGTSEVKQTLKGLTEEGFGLSWNPNTQGMIAAATGKDVCVWQVE